MLETSARLLRLLSILQSRKDWGAEELAERLNVTTRTVRNDIGRLRGLGYRIDSMKGPGGGYWLAPGGPMPPLLLDDDEAVAIVLAMRGAASGAVRGIDEASAQAMAKLNRLLPSRLQQRVFALEASVEQVPTRGPDVDMDLLVLIATASRDRRRIGFDYRRHDGSSSRRKVEPHRLVNDRSRWYLLGWDADRDDWRTFRVDRISDTRIWPGKTFTVRSLDDAVERVTTGAATAMWQYRAVVIARAPAEVLIQRLPPAVQVEPIDADSCRLHVGSSGPDVLARYLGLMGVDFTLEDPEKHEDLVNELRLLSHRLLQAVHPGP